MYDKSATFIIFIVIPALAGYIGIKQPETVIVAQPEAKIEIVAETTEPPSTPPTLDELIDKYFPAEARERAGKIAHCESGEREDAIGHNRNGTIDSGYFQINSIHKARVDGDINKLLDGEINVRVASEIYAEQGWSPWTCNRKV